MNNKYTLAALICAAIFTSGCAQQSAISIEQSPTTVPKSWSQSDKIALSKSDNAWLTELVNEPLASALGQAIEQNYSLQQQYLALQAFQQNAVISGATLWPELDLSFSNTRRKNANESLTTNHGLNLGLRYELDIWGKLSANDQQVNLQLASQVAQFQQSQTNLIGDVILAWFQAAQARQLLQLSEKRYHNSQQNLAIIESGYESGLNAALDVYLSRNQVATEQARLASQRTALSLAVRNLELLLGRYPAGLLAQNDSLLPTLTSGISASLPSEVIANKAELRASWLALLAKDAGLAYAHKQRFPSLAISANLAKGNNDLSDLLSASTTWSLVGNVTQPIFNAGRLKANEQRARLETKQAEQAYLGAVNAAFAAVESGLTKSQNLALNAQANQQAAENAVLAQQLSFEQYLKGLVTYTTVLDAQTRAFNAQSALIQAQYQLLENRVQLHIALGGDFQSLIPNGTLAL